jgi:hypothetical protein
MRFLGWSGGGGIRTLEGPRRPLAIFETSRIWVNHAPSGPGARHNARQFWWVPARSRLEGTSVITSKSMPRSDSTARSKSSSRSVTLTGASWTRSRKSSCRSQRSSVRRPTLIHLAVTSRGSGRRAARRDRPHAPGQLRRPRHRLPGLLGRHRRHRACRFVFLPAVAACVVLLSGRADLLHPSVPSETATELLCHEPAF